MKKLELIKLLEDIQGNPDVLVQSQEMVALSEFTSDIQCRDHILGGVVSRNPFIVILVPDTDQDLPPRTNKYTISEGVVKSNYEIPYARVICPKCGTMDLTEIEYNTQIRSADRRWCCPKCHEEAQFDDTHYENKIEHVNQPKICEKCGCKDGSVIFVPDPYLEEIKKNEMPFWQCSKCFDKSLDSI